MTWLLDTNVCIRYVNGRSPAIRRRLDSTSSASICTCSIVKAEMHFGALKSYDPDNALARHREFLSRFRSLSFDDSAAEHYGSIRAELSKRGLMIGSNDLLIAAICVANQLTLVTHNVSEFSRIACLAIDDWESDSQ